jgi:hypothetical protein
MAGGRDGDRGDGRLKLPHQSRAATDAADGRSGADGAPFDSDAAASLSKC